MFVFKKNVFLIEYIAFFDTIAQKKSSHFSELLINKNIFIIYDCISGFEVSDGL
jgi:hypothetical protein